MAVATEQNNETQQQAFDAKAFIDKRNEAEAAARNPKPAEAKTETPAKPEETTKPPEQPDHIGRSARREINRLRDEAAELRGKLAAYEELGVIKPPAAAAPAAPKKDEDPEPQRKDFADDAQYYRALGRWDARQEANKLLSKKDEQTAKQQEFEQYRGQIQAMNEKADKDMALFADWNEVQKAAEESGENTFNPKEHEQLMILLALSDVKAGLTYHFCKEPKSLEALLKLTAKPGEQIKLFHRLEGQVEKLYYTNQPAAQAGQGGDSPKATAAGKDRTAPEKGKQPNERRSAALPAPTESAAATRGSTPSSDVKPINEDGTLNPLWKQQRNEREGLRR